jgi:hypothetical protein
MSMLETAGEMLKCWFGQNSILDFGSEPGHLFFECEFESFGGKIHLHMVLKQETSYCLDLQDLYIGAEGQPIEGFLLNSENFLNYIGGIKIEKPGDIFELLSQYNRVADMLGYTFKLNVMEPPRLSPFPIFIY